jgi:hypothetical protein
MAFIWICRKYNLERYSLNADYIGLRCKVSRVEFRIKNKKQTNKYFILVCTGGGVYWAGRATARPLLGVNGQATGLARPLLKLVKIYAVC